MTANRNGKSPRAGRRLPVGAEVLPGGGVHFRVWAPQKRHVEVRWEKTTGQRQQKGRLTLKPEDNGYFSGLAPSIGAGARYGYRLDHSPATYPDPASRFQPEGPHGLSEVIDPGTFKWTDAAWPGVPLEGQILYEMHVGTFTPQGTWKAAARQLPELARLGITLLEIMPVADFPGRFGWSYDGVDLFAPCRLYGRPDHFRAFINQAHRLGIGAVLDVVYNHFGPEANYLPKFSTDYLSKRHMTDWGQGLNYDGRHNGPVREFILSNARFWVEEFHLDGLRIDATQHLFDDSEDHILGQIVSEVRRAAPGRATFILGENEPQNVRMIRSAAQGGFAMEAVWNDDFHHSARVAMTGRNEAYYTDYLGRPQEFVAAAKFGYLYQGQRYKWQKKRRGTPTFGLKPAQFVHYIQNHDQVANSFHGHRIQTLTSPGRLRALTALLLLGPWTPLLFQGQEFAASTPFLYFGDLEKGLAKLVFDGRKEFLSQFPSLATAEVQERLPDPLDPACFRRCKLRFEERKKHSAIYELHRDLIRLRKGDKLFRAQRPGAVDGAALDAQSLVLRFFGEEGDDRLLAVNLGRQRQLDPAPEPLLAPPENRLWEVLWSSEDPRYGGDGTPTVDGEDNWCLPAESALVLRPQSPARDDQ